MSNLVLIDPNIVSLIIGSFGSDGMPMPFVQEIFLIDCNVAGTSHLDLEKIEPQLMIDDLLITKREPSNKYDAHAIMILTKEGEKLGYIPREKNEIISRLMDAGKIIFGRIISKKWQNDWLRMSIKIYLRDI